MPYQFSPPTRLEQRGTHPLFGRLRWSQGITLLKEGGFYRQVRDPSAEEVDAADIAYLGGHEYRVSDDEADALIANGYGAFLEDVPLGYGNSPYGELPYGF